MQTLFWRTYLILGLTLLVSIAILSTFLINSYYQEAVRDEQGFTQSPHRLLLRELKNNPTVSPQSLLEQWQPFLSYRLHWHDWNELALDPKELDLLTSNQPLVKVNYDFSQDHITSYWPVAEPSGVISYHRTYDTSGQNRAFNSAILIIAIITLPAAIFFLLYPIAKVLQQISIGVKQFAEGDLTKRLTLKAPKPFLDLSQDLNSMANQLQKQMEEQVVMSHAISHELKTPLTRLRMENDLALMTEDTNELIEYVNQVTTELDQLEDLVESILTLAKYTHSNRPLEMNNFDLMPLLHQILERFKANPVTLNANNLESLTVHSDIGGLTHLLINLISNAVRHAQKQVEVTIETGDKLIALHIDDDGPGIPEAEREQIFLPFARLDKSRSRDSGGTGLGLAIVRVIADKLSATVTTTSSPTFGGARFSVVLPGLNSTSH